MLELVIGGVLAAAAVAYVLRPIFRPSAGTAERACAACGGPAAAGAAYCTRCGQPLSEAPDGCAACGAPLAAGAQFCARCGAGVAS